MTSKAWFAILLCGLVLIVFTATNVFAQTRIGGAQPPSTITRPESIQDSGIYDYWTQISDQSRAGGALLGKLAVEGEPLPWEPLLVTVNCAGKVAYTTQTDAKGNFAISGIALPGALGNQGDSQRQMETQFDGCTVQAVVPGFHSTVVTLTQKYLRDQTDLGTLMISREGRDVASTLSSTTETASPNAVKLFEKARGEMLDHNPDGAERQLKKAVQADPKFAEAWLQLGKLQETADPQAARDSFAKAIEADPKFVLPYEQLAAVSAQSGNWPEVLNNTNHVAQLDPAGTPESWYLNALANFQAGKIPAAEASAQKSLAIDPRHSVLNTEQLLAVILARKGDYAGALEHLRSSLNYVPPGANADLLKQQIAQLEKRAKTK